MSDAEIPLTALPIGFFDSTAAAVARNLIGTFFLSIDESGNQTGGEIIETEAYDQQDAAAHCYFPPATRRSDFGKADAMFMAGGAVYVFRTQNGCCVNFVSDKAGVGSGVLIRALRPRIGIPIMRQRHRDNYEAAWVKDDAKFVNRLCQGPELLCVSMGVTSDHNAGGFAQAGLDLRLGNEPPDIGVGPRIRVEGMIESKWPGLDAALKAVAINRLWRFVDLQHREFLSDLKYPIYKSPNYER